MQTIKFYELPRAAQERFVGSVNGSGLPAPILSANLVPRAPLAWIGASVVSSVFLFVFYRIGFGSVDSGLVKEGVVWMVIDVLLVGLAVFGVIRALAIRRDHRTSPFRRGVYVFPVGVIDARSPSLQLYPIDELSNVTGPDARGVTLTFGSASFSFPSNDPGAVTSVKEALDGARLSVVEAGAATDSVRPKALAALDPLQGYANPLMSSDKMVRTTPAWATFGLALAGVAGAALGISLFTIRNARSDDALYGRAVEDGSTASLRSYLEKGSRHQAEVSQVLLPRAELRDAQQIGTVSAIEQFISDHPKTLILPEAQAALRAATLVELDAAKKAGTLAALDDFKSRHPHGGVDAELQVARHAVYQAALAKYVAQAPPKNQAEIAFVQKLVAWVEKNGPKVEVRFHRLHSKTIDKADGAVTKHRDFKGAISFPSRYFDAKAVKGDEDALAADIVQRFGAVFPPEILTLVAGDSVADPDAPLPAQVIVPTLFIEHGPVWSGYLVTVKVPRGLFVGLQIGFDAAFRLPDDTKPVRVKDGSWRIPNFRAATDPEKPEESIYADMRAKAFEQFKKRLFDAFFTNAAP